MYLFSSTYNKKPEKSKPLLISSSYLQRKKKSLNKMTAILYHSPEYVRPTIPVCLAKYFKGDIECVDIATVPEKFAKDFPLKKCPALIDHDNGVYLTETIAILNYLIKHYDEDPEDITQLTGSSILEESEILRWESFAVTDFVEREAMYLKPLLGHLPFDAKTNEQTKHEFKVVAQIYEDHLNTHQFLVSDHVTLADLASVGSFHFGFTFAFDGKWSQQYPNITRWYKEVTNTPYVVDFFKTQEQARAFPTPPN